MKSHNVQISVFFLSFISYLSVFLSVRVFITVYHAPVLHIVMCEYA